MWVLQKPSLKVPEILINYISESAYYLELLILIYKKYVANKIFLSTFSRNLRMEMWIYIRHCVSHNRNNENPIKNLKGKRLQRTECYFI